MMQKPHLQIGQKGKGKGKKKGKKNQPKPYVPGPLPTQMPEVGGFPQQGNPGPGFLPPTPQSVLGQYGANDAQAQAANAYTKGSQLVPAQYNLGMARLNTDKGYATNSLNEDLAGRGIFDSSWRPYLYGKDIATPYGRAAQDLALGAAGQYEDLASGYGGALLDAQRQRFGTYAQNAQDAFSQNLLGANVGQYQAPNQPGFVPSYAPKGKPRPKGKKKKKGKK